MDLTIVGICIVNDEVSLGVLCVKLSKFITELCPLVGGGGLTHVRISYLLNILLSMNQWNWAQFNLHMLDIDKV